MQQLAAVEGMTMIIVSHEMGFAARLPAASRLHGRGVVVEQRPLQQDVRQPSA